MVIRTDWGATRSRFAVAFVKGPSVTVGMGPTGRGQRVPGEHAIPEVTDLVSIPATEAKPEDGRVIAELWARPIRGGCGSE